MRRRVLHVAFFLSAGLFVNAALMWSVWSGLSQTYPVLKSEEPALGGLLPYEPNWIWFAGFTAALAGILWCLTCLPFMLYRSNLRASLDFHGPGLG